MDRGPDAPARHGPSWRRHLIAATAIALVVAAAVAAAGGPSRVPWLWQRTFVQPTDPPTPAATRDERWRQDLAYLRENLVRLHGGAFHSVSRERFEAAFAGAAARVHASSDGEQIAETMRLVALIGDGHTTTWSWLETLRPYPVRFGRVGGEWVVLATEPRHAVLLGARLLTLGDVPVDAAARRLAPLASAETASDHEARVARLMAYPELLHARGVQAAPQSGAITVRTASGVQRTVALAAGARGSIGLLRADADLILHLEPDADHAWTLLEDDLVYLRYRRCRDPVGFAAVAEPVLTVLERRPDARLIVDLRRNGGGDSTVIRPLLDGLLRLGAGDRTFALTDAGTYSSATMNAHDLRRLGATLIGEPTGDALAGWGEVRSFVLPNSRQRIQVSTFRFRGDDRPVRPDVAVVPTIDDWLAGRDPVLDAAARR